MPGAESISSGPHIQVRSLKRKDTDRDDASIESISPFSMLSRGPSGVRSPQESEISAVTFPSASSASPSSASTTSRRVTSNQDDRPRRFKQPRLSADDTPASWREPLPGQPELEEAEEEHAKIPAMEQTTPIPFPVLRSHPRKVRPSGLSFATSAMALDTPQSQPQAGSSSSRRSSDISNPSRRIHMTRSRAMLLAADPRIPSDHPQD
jgi:hypothetical protein